MTVSGIAGVMRMMRIRKGTTRFFAVVSLSFALMLVCTSPVFAETADEGVDAIAITVIVPPSAERQARNQAPRRLFPVNVAEGYNYDGIRELKRIYELLPNESPEWINSDSFARNGYYYQIAEITRQVNVAHTVREHTETVYVQSATNDLAAVIAGLDTVLEFTDEDGYAGMLHLDIRSIEMTQDGTRSTSRIVSQVREYPHLSNPDLALIPQTITVNGRTYTLSNVDWRTNTSTPIDFNSVPQTFTAVATYTRTATSTVSTGYTTVAAYSGILTRVSTGDVRFVATFIGTPIVSPIINRPAPTPEPYAVADEKQDETKIETPIICPPSYENGSNGADYGYNEPITPETQTPQETITEPSEYSQNSGIFALLLLLAIPVALIILALLLLMLRFKKQADTLKRQGHGESADIAYSRTAQIIQRDRELTSRADYKNEPREFVEIEDEESDGFVADHDNSNEDGDDSVV